jgi:hypothetical protein
MKAFFLLFTLLIAGTVRGDARPMVFVLLRFVVLTGWSILHFLLD